MSYKDVCTVTCSECICFHCYL